jgi:hypothetical protein
MNVGAQLVMKMSNGVITICLNKEMYYHWSEILFKSILIHTNIDFALVYDNEEWFKKYNLDKLVKYPIYKTDIQNPYLFKYELINYTPFDNTIFLDADTIIFKDITPLFNEQCFSICSEWNGEWIFNKFSFIDNPNEIVKKNKLNKLYSAYSGYLRFEKTDFYKELFKKVLNQTDWDKNLVKKYGRTIMPDEYYLNLTISNYNFKEFIPIQIYFMGSIISNDMIGYSYQGQLNNNIENEVLNKIKNTLNILKINLNINNLTLNYKSKII